MKWTRKIDHIVYVVPDLEEAMDDLEQKMGVRSTFGGYHNSKGTKNALLDLGNEIYLELLAIDEENKTVSSPRWMGIDLVQQATITRWALKSTNLTYDSQVVQEHNKEMGRMEQGQRKMEDGKMLTWDMILPLANPPVDIVPFMVDWQHSDIHPTEHLPPFCELIEIGFSHPHPQIMTKLMSKLHLDLDIKKPQPPQICIKIKCPKGIIEL